jgi:hypothetical protein
MTEAEINIELARLEAEEKVNRQEFNFVIGIRDQVQERVTQLQFRNAAISEERITLLRALQSQA